MTSRFPSLVALLFAVSATAPASAETATNPGTPTYRFSSIGVADNTLIIAHFSSTNPDCTVSGKTFVRVSRNPGHGVVTMREGLGFGNFPKQPECNSRKMEGVTVEYTPYDGFTGSDEVEFDVVSQTGSEVFVTYAITVKAWDSSDASFRIQEDDLSPSEAALASGELPDAEVEAQVTEIVKPPMDLSKAEAPAPPSESPASLRPRRTHPAGQRTRVRTQEYAPMLPGGARAAMLIASPDNPQKPVVNLGSTVWSTIPPAPGQPATVAVKADADIPDLKMHATMTLRKNTDPTLQATHTIDLKFSFADGAPIAGFKDVGAPQMREIDFDRVGGADQRQGQNQRCRFPDRAYQGRSGRRSQSRPDGQTCAWFDFPLLLNDNRTAKLVFQKSTGGEAMLDKAFDAWKPETPAVAPAPAGAPLLSADMLPQYKFAHAATELQIVGGNADTRYFTIVYGMIRSHLRAPSGPSAAPSRGGAIVFTVNAGGNLVQRKVISSSGSLSLDMAVMEAIAEAAPYPAPPDWRTRRMRLTYGK